MLCSLQRRGLAEISIGQGDGRYQGPQVEADAQPRRDDLDPHRRCVAAERRQVHGRPATSRTTASSSISRPRSLDFHVSEGECASVELLSCRHGRHSVCDGSDQVLSGSTGFWWVPTSSKGVFKRILLCYFHSESRQVRGRPKQINRYHLFDLLVSLLLIHLPTNSISNPITSTLLEPLLKILH